jgi:2-keto-3-deoxygluconate permease
MEAEMKIKATLDRIPGGMMVVPLLLAATINTFVPDLLRIGNFTEALFVKSAGALIALFLLCAGAQINLRNVGAAFAKGATLLVMKWLVGGLVGLLAYVFAGPDGLFLGLVPLAIIAAMTNSNGGLYVAIVGQYGKAEDKAAYSLLALNDGPFLTMVALAIFGVMGFVDGFFSIISFISVLLPIVVGMVLGNADEDMRAFLAKGSDMLIPFFAFALGMGIDFNAIINGGGAGVLLGVMTVLFTGTAGYLIFRAFRWNPIVGAAEGSTAGNAVATPMAIATANAAFAPVAKLATVQVAASTVTTAILLPLFISFLVKVFGNPDAGAQDAPQGDKTEQA